MVACKYMKESGGWSCNIANSDRTGKGSKRRRGHQRSMKEMQDLDWKYV